VYTSGGTFSTMTVGMVDPPFPTTTIQADLLDWNKVYRQPFAPFGWRGIGIGSVFQPLMWLEN
jgi:hypothetical protein